jgi:uncharacterized protein YecE (DUF72 family)
VIRVGIGGWTYEPWRGSFYPDKLPQKRELEYASRKLTSIEINGTYYGAQKPESFARWHDETPDDFVFSVKGPRFTTNRRVLAEAGASVERFLTGGVLELKQKLGPINWQMLPTKQFDPEDFAAFLRLLPAEVNGRALRHVVEVRHPSFVCAEFVTLLREHRVATVIADHAAHPLIADATAPFIYVRLQRALQTEASGYSRAALGQWLERCRAWAKGEQPQDMPTLAKPERKASRSRDVFVYMINGYKPKAPAAAIALIERLSA